MRGISASNNEGEDREDAHDIRLRRNTPVLVGALSEALDDISLVPHESE